MTFSDFITEELDKAICEYARKERITPRTALEQLKKEVSEPTWGSTEYNPELDPSHPKRHV